MKANENSFQLQVSNITWPMCFLITKKVHKVRNCTKFLKVDPLNINQCVWMFYLIGKLLKEGLDAVRMTLWASIWWPSSQAMVTSAKYFSLTFTYIISFSLQQFILSNSLNPVCLLVWASTPCSQLEPSPSYLFSQTRSLQLTPQWLPSLPAL